MTRVALIGMGKMGRALEALAPERGCEVVARIDASSSGTPVVDRSTFRDAEVAIEFTTASAAPANVRACVDAGLPVVVGTTGWYEQLGELSTYVKANGGAMIAEPNFSVGVFVFRHVVARAAPLLGAAPGFDVHLVETHHAAKKDAPSGTAVMLASEFERGAQREVSITSVRTGSVPGTHELLVDGPFETIVLRHAARDRRVFADGALLAARWLAGRQGIYSLADVLADAMQAGATTSDSARS